MVFRCNSSYLGIGTFLKSVNYRVAFAPSPTAMWTSGWANWNPQNSIYASTNVTVSDSITTNTVWTQNNVHEISSLIYVTNNATLTVEVLLLFVVMMLNQTLL
jgi:hypothetical protein